MRGALLILCMLTHINEQEYITCHNIRVELLTSYVKLPCVGYVGLRMPT